MTETETILNWYFEKRCRQVINALEKNGFKAVYCQSTQMAFYYILKEAEAAETVGLGGSRTVADLKIADRLQEMGKDLLISKRPGISLEEGMAIRRRQLTCDLFLCGTNAVTLSGYLINIENTGNRIGAMTFGPL